MSGTGTILTGRTLPVSTSTSTSAKQTPCTPVPARLVCHTPCPVTPDEGKAAHACFHERVFPPPLTLPPLKLISSGFALSSRGESLSATASRALTAPRSEERRV